MERLRELLAPLDYYDVEREYKDYNINWGKLYEYLSQVDIKGIAYPSPYLKKIIFSEIDSGKYVANEIVETISMNSVFRHLETLNYEIELLGSLGIESVLNALLSKNCDISNIRELLDKAIDYNQEKTTKKLYELLLCSNTVKKYGIDVDKISKQVEKDSNEYAKLLDQMKIEKELEY